MRRTPRSAAGPVPCGRHWKIALCSLSIGRRVAPDSVPRDQQRAREHQGFLFASSRRCRRRRRERRAKAGRANDGSHDEFRLRQRRDRRHRLRSRVHLRRDTLGREPLTEPRGRGTIDERRMVRPEAAALLQHRFVIGSRGERNHAEAIRMRGGDGERVLADGPGRTEDDQSLHDRSPSQHRPSASSGTDEVRLSMRSSMPPWPGSRLPLSLSPPAA